jgi:hypothetical protein
MASGKKSQFSKRAALTISKLIDHLQTFAFHQKYLKD